MTAAFVSASSPDARPQDGRPQDMLARKREHRDSPLTGAIRLIPFNPCSDQARFP